MQFLQLYKQLNRAPRLRMAGDESGHVVEQRRLPAEALGERLQARKRDVLALGCDKKFIRNWDYYLGMCAAAFAVGRIDVAQIELVHAWRLKILEELP